jgi:RecA-family ATPase
MFGVTAITPGYENARRERRELMRQGRQAINGALAPSVDPTAEPSFDPITTIQFPNLPEKEPPPRWFVWAGWLPAGCLSAVYGAGGIGKTLLAQQLATHVAIGRPFLGADVARSPVSRCSRRTTKS